MAEKEQEPLSLILEGEELNLELEDLTDSEKKRKPQGSMKSAGDTPLSPLIRAVRRGSSSTSLFFQDSNINELDVKETDNFQRNAFHYAISKPDCLRKLLKLFENKTFVKEALNQADKEGETPIHHAAITANIESLEILYEYDNSLFKLTTSIGKRSVLHLAVKSRSVIAVKFVLSKDPSLINSVDNMSQTPVHYAASLKQPSVLEFFISRGAATTERDANDQLPVHIAASKGLRNIIELLLNEDPDILDAVDNSDQTPLLLAAKNGCPVLVSYLLTKNASYELKDTRGFTAFDWAIYRDCSDVVRVFLESSSWKEVLVKSHYGPETSLTFMIENMPAMAKTLLDKCIATKGTKQNPDYEEKYDFFCLESIDTKVNCPRFEAITVMVDNVSEICLRHPVTIKYVDAKWRKRGFKYSLATIILTLIFHTCLMLYTTRVIGVVTMRQEIRHSDQDATTVRHVRKRDGIRPDADEMMALRVIMLMIIVGSFIKEVLQVVLQRFRYFTYPAHYFRLAVGVSVMVYLLPVNQALTANQIAGGAISVMLSWLNLIQFLTVVPVIGLYIILVQKVFWTLIKIFTVVLIYLLSFASTFYVLLAEHESFRSIPMSIVSTFVAMIDGIDYDTLFVAYGWYARIYELKLVLLVLFILTMSIVVNNALIGLAVGDTNDVMKSARFDKLLRRAKFIIQLERSLNRLPGMKCVENQFLVEFPARRKSTYQRIIDMLYFGSKMDAVDGGTEDEGEFDEMEISLEDHIDKVVETKFESLRSSLQHELKGIQDHIEEDRKDLKEKFERILEKLK